VKEFVVSMSTKLTNACLNHTILQSYSRYDTIR